MKTRILLIAMMMFCPAFAISQTSYYYYRGSKIYIQENLQKVSVITPKGSALLKSQVLPINSSRAEIINDAAYDIAVYERNEPFINQSASVPYRMSLKNTFGINSIILPSYKNSTGEELIMTNYLNIKLKQASDLGKLQTIATKYHLTNLKQNKFMPLWYSLTITSQTPGTTLEVANTIFETGLFASSFADFSYDAHECSYDPDFSKQWGLYNSNYDNVDISICSAWNYATGRGIKIAFVDEGIDLSHADLASNISGLSYDTDTGASPSVVYGDHGTHCAGIAGAVRNNGIKMAGVAPDATLMSVSDRLIRGTEGARKRADGINWAWKNGADIISCSWKADPNDMIADAIDGALDHGREGKGAIFVKSAGNAWGGPITWPGYYRPEVLTVGSITITGSIAESASVGPAMDVVAPGDNIWSTLPNNRTGYMSGTSMAAPHVSGLAALILERNPRLTGQQVRDIIEKNTKKIGNLSYNIEKVNGTWNEEYGYGLVNAYEAIKSTPR